MEKSSKNGPERDWGLPPLPSRRVPVGSANPDPNPDPEPVGGRSAREQSSVLDAFLDAKRAHHRRWLGLVVIAFSQLLIVVDATIMNVALPALSEDLELAHADRQWVLTAYSLAFGGLLLLCGRVADYLGLRRTLVIGLIGFAAASAVGGAAQNLETLLSARAAQGAFGALLAPAALALVTTTFTDTHERAKAFAIFGVVAGGGSALGLIAGGILTEYANWRWTMYVNVPLAVMSVAGAYLYLDEVRGEHPGRLDLIGTVLATGGLVSVVYSFSEAERNGWTEPLTLALLGVGLSLLILFVLSQKMVRNPLLPLRVLADRTRAGANVAITLAALSMIGAFFFLTFYLQTVLGFAPVKTGVAFLPVTGGVVVASAVISGLMPKVAPRVLLGVGLLGAGGALILLSQMTAGSDYASDLLPALVLMGICMGAVFVPAFNAATHGVAPRDAGVAGAVVNATQQVGASLGVALLSTVAASRTSDYLAGRQVDAGVLIDAQVAGYARASLVAGLILVAATVFVVLMVNVRRLIAHPGLGEAGPIPPVAVAEPTEFSAHAPSAAALMALSPSSAVPWAEPGENAADTAGLPRGPVPFAGTTPVPASIPAVFMEADDVTDPQFGIATNGNHPAPPPPPGPPPAPPGVPQPAQYEVSQPAAHGAPFSTPDPVAAPMFSASVPPQHPVPPAPGHVPVQHAGPSPAAPVAAPPAPATGPSLRVLVRRTDGAPVAAAAVTLLDAEGAQVSRAETDGHGSASFGSVPGGEFLLVVRHEGYLPQARTVLLQRPPAPTVEVEVQVPGAARVSGTVRTGTGRVVEGALVTLTGVDGTVAASTRTDVEGTYELVDLTVEEGTLAVFAPSVRPIAIPVAIAPGNRVRQDVEVHGSGAISGTAQTPEGWLIADARVSLVSDGVEVAVTRTDADGTYSFAGLEPGTYTVVAVGYPPAQTEIVAGPGAVQAPPITLAHED